MDTAIAEDSEVLSGGDCDARLVERAKLDGVTVERGFENRHGLDLLGTLIFWIMIIFAISVSLE